MAPPVRRAALVALALALGACGGGGDDGVAPLTPVAPGAEALVLDEVSGPAIVNVWATWCAPCRAELPALQAVSDSDPAVARVIGVNVGDEPAAVEAFLAELGVSFEQYLDPDGELMNSLGIVGLPASVILDADGTVVEVHQGALDEAGFRALVTEVAP